MDLSSKVFSGKYLPSQWVNRKPVQVNVYKVALNTICPNTKLIGQITRSTNTTSFLLYGSRKYYVCQFAPPASEKVVFPWEEKYNPRKFDGAIERMAHLKSHGICVPTIRSRGSISINDLERQYIVTDFVKGIGADILLSEHPNMKLKVYFEFGKTLSKLTKVPLKEDVTLPSNDIILTKIKHAGEFISHLGCITPKQAKRLIIKVEDRLNLLGNQPASYVHLDPTPTNLHINYKKDSVYVTLMDVEAFRVGHPIVEGLGKAVMIGIYDWYYLTNEDPTTIQTTVNAFLDGYSLNLPYAQRVKRSKNDLEWLIETCRLIHLPQSIMYEYKKDTSYFATDEKSTKWSIKVLHELLSDS